MPFEFEALVGHLYVVGGRTVSAAPPGALCEVAPKNAARGRELDTLFTLILPGSGSNAPAKFYEDMAQQAANKYFESTGSVTAGLRDVFNTLNNAIYEQNRQSGKATFEANVVLGVLRGKDLIVGRVGGAVVLITHHGGMQTFPPDLNDDDALFTAPMGVHPVPNVRMTQFQVETATRVIFGDHNLADLVHDQMASAMQSADLGTVLVAFQELARLQMQVLAFEFVPLEATPEGQLPVGQSTRQVTAQMRAAGRTTGEQAATTSDATPRRQRNRGKEINRRAKRNVGKAATGLGGGFTVVQRMIDHFFSPREGNRGPFGISLGASSVVLLPVIVVGMVVMLWLSGTGETEFEICLQEAQDNVSLAQSVANQDRVTVQSAWELALNKIDECQEIRPNDVDLAGLEREGQSTLDSLNNITRRPATPIASMPSAELTDIVMRGTTMYTLDSLNDIVYRIDVTGDGLAAVNPNGTPIQEMRRGGRVSGIPINGEIIGLAFDQRVTSDEFVAVSRDGVLIRCPLGFNAFCTGQFLQGTEAWVNPTQIAMWNSNLYILDPGANQVWRYRPVGNTLENYGNAPEEYFGASVAIPPLDSAVDFTIDGEGIVYILLREGNVLRYFGGDNQPFGYTLFPDGQQITNATSMYIDTRPTENDLYIIQADRRALYAVSWVGNYRAQFRTNDDTDFDLIRKMVAVPSGDGQRNMFYVVSGNTVFAMSERG